ncbi:transcriptional regulator [Streptomyces glaucescens]|uniref:Putative transcriptional regulator n=1 Tax=Streptomyces glaucescens TaxID=1907 RepID=A0A089XMW4_STRGA|nr:transcriptional regulator [Streptomyces glaucescens]AIS02575.1 putative transcriptional regulator [Streptomyces glaucescens]
MERRSLLGAGVVLGAAVVVRPPAARSAEHPAVSDAELAAVRALFAAGAYERLGRLLPLLLDGAEHGVEAGPAGAARAAWVWVLASQLAVKQGRTGAAGAYAGLAGAAARRSGNAVVLAAAARAGATPLRRTGRTPEALALLKEARAHLTAGPRPSAAELDAAGMVELTAAYTAAQAHQTSTARDFADEADQTALRLARRPHAGGRPLQLSAGQCTLYRIGIHRHLGDLDTALAHAARLDAGQLPTAERRARAATDTARALLDADDAAGAFTQLRLVELAAPAEARRPSVRALTAEVAGARPGLPGLDAYLRRTAPGVNAPAG